MATKTYTFRGKIKWANNLFVPDDYNGVKNFKACMYDLDDASMKAFKESGIRVNFRDPDDQGHEVVQFKRPPSKEINGQEVEFGRPVVVMESGEPLEDIIGHGSEVSAEVVVYDSKFGKGHRLNKVVIHELVLVPDENSDDSAKKAFME